MPSSPTDRPSTLSPDLTTLAAAQRDMRLGYLGGALGMLVSGLVWAVAAGVALWKSPESAILALFIGGALIHPLAVLLLKVCGAPGKHAKHNPLSSLGFATTFWMIMMLPLAYGVSTIRMDLFFPAMLFVIGGRYLCFQTLYGGRLYWIVGAALALAGVALALLQAPPVVGAVIGALIEIVFAGVILADARREASSV